MRLKSQFNLQSSDTSLAIDVDYRPLPKPRPEREKDAAKEPGVTSIRRVARSKPVPKPRPVRRFESIKQRSTRDSAKNAKPRANSSETKIVSLVTSGASSSNFDSARFEAPSQNNASKQTASLQVNDKLEKPILPAKKPVSNGLSQNIQSIEPAGNSRAKTGRKSLKITKFFIVGVKGTTPAGSSVNISDVGELTINSNGFLSLYAGCKL